MRPTSQTKRSYGQFCSLARAFDIIGERWTPLLIRELALGPKRFTDLVVGLPGIGLSLLAARLKELEAEGVICQRRLPPPAARNVYDLTDDGRDLFAALGPLARWGAKRLGPLTDDETFRTEWFLLYMRVAADHEAARRVHDVYEFHVDDEVMHVVVDDGEVDAQRGPAPRPADLVMRTDRDTFIGIGTGELDPTSPKVAKRMRIEGDAEAAARCLAILAR